MKILVTGASGFIGRNLVNALNKGAHDVAGCGLLADGKPPEPGRFETIDLRDLEALKRFVRAVQPEIVFHLGARTDLLGRSLQDYAVNTTGVDNVIEACSAVASVRRVIFASSRMVCRIDHVPNSYDEYCPPNFYGESKAKGEMLVRRADQPYEWVLFRPTSIWGPGFGIPYRDFFDQIRKRHYVHPIGYRPLKSFGYVENTIFQLECLMSAEKSQIHGRTFYVGDYEPLDVTTWAEYIHRAFGLSGTIRNVPMPLLRTAARFGDALNFASGKDMAPLTTFRLNNLITNMVYPQLAELRELTGPLPCGWKQGTDRTVNWLLGAGI
jgi:GlcNAc-P-P-Und epimerase